MCPNCGAFGYDGQSCKNCRHNAGEKLYKPYWMNKKAWDTGVGLHWNYETLKKRKRIK